jgi:hypothetical protein
MPKQSERERKRQERLAIFRTQMANMGSLIIDKNGHDLSDRISEAILDYSGDLTVLESAIGALFLAKTFGWQVVRLIHSTKTYTKYERLLSAGLSDGKRFRFADHFEKETEQSDRSFAFKLTKTIDSFWKVARGEVGVPEGQKMIEAVVGIDFTRPDPA